MSLNAANRILALWVFVTLLGFLTEPLLGQENLIHNGGFEQGSASWELGGDFSADDRFPNSRTGSGYAYLSNPDGTRGNNLSGTLSQRVTIPLSIEEATLSLHYSISTDEPTTAGVAKRDMMWVVIEVQKSHWGQVS